MGGWYEDGEFVPDLTDADDDDPIWDEAPDHPEHDLAADGDLHRKAIREGST